MSLCRLHNEHVLCAAAAVLLVSTAVSLAEPAWTHTGDCKECHTVTPPSSLMWIVNSDGQSDPDGAGPLPLLKVFEANRGQTGKNLTVQLANLNPGDGYAVAMVGLSKPGVLTSAQLLYSADCGWADWDWGQDHFYSNPARYNKWGSGPTVFSYSIGIDATASYDYYDVLFAVVGVKADTGERFYQEEHFYMTVPPPNWSPAVTITAPLNNTTFTTPTDVTITAAASDPDGTVTKVEFFAGATLLGQATTPPYTITWAQVPLGNYALSARATDNLGATNLSPTVNIVVSLPPPVPGDFDHDGDVDQADYAHLQICLAGTGGVVTPQCTDASLDGDASVDSIDVLIFARCLSGANVRGNPECAN